MTTETACTHHYLIEEACGPKSKGVCKKCGKEDIFSNSVPLVGSVQANLASAIGDSDRGWRAETKQTWKNEHG